MSVQQLKQQAKKTLAADPFPQQSLQRQQSSKKDAPRSPIPASKVKASAATSSTPVSEEMKAIVHTDHHVLIFPLLICINL
jgi:hypothetical protein